ncbi:hypothetical protein GF322_00115 [Candidatus Dependentiae bacterium]|nr:hypothetical protein [Candidatus Dependentiae bacterium]
MQLRIAFFLYYFLFFNVFAEYINTKSNFLPYINFNDISNNKEENIKNLLNKRKLIEESLNILSKIESNKEMVINEVDCYKLKKNLLEVAAALGEKYFTESTVNIVLNNKEAEEFYARKNALARFGSRNLLLQVIIPVIVTIVIFYLLINYYKDIIKSTWPKFLSFKDLSLWEFLCNLWSGFKSIFTTNWKQRYRSFCRQILEIIIAIARLYVVGKKTNSIIVDGLRISSGTLFLINKNQFSAESFKQGAYYTLGWLFYDLFHLIKTFYDDESKYKTEETDFIINGNNTQYKQTSDFLCYYLIPFTESAIALYLSLHITDTDLSINARKNMQAIYSLVRILPVYLKKKRNSIDALLTINLFIVALDFLR